MSGNGKNLASRAHSQPRECREIDKSGHGNRLTDRRAPTSWRLQRGVEVRIQKQSQQEARGTHLLDRAKGGTSHDMVRIRASEGHSRPGLCGGRGEL
jgi:hypothetical protein